MRKLFRKIYPHLHEFTIGLKVSPFSNQLENDHFKAFGLELKEDVRDDFANFDPAHKFFDLKKDEVFLVCTGIKAHDRFSAIDEAVQKSSLLQNLFRLYHHRETFEIQSKVLVAQCCSDEVALCTRDHNVMHSLEDERPAKAGQRLEDLLRETSLLRGSDASRFISLAEFHGMGLDSGSVENQIINLWIGLETLSPSRPGKSKIDNVITAIMPVTGLSYTTRLVRRLSVDLLTWKRSRVSNCLKDISPAIDGPLGKVLAVLTIPDYEPKLAELLEIAEDFELLRYRLFRTHEVFSSPRKLASFISEHQMRVAWQIRRIYRVRNSIVHLGQKPRFTANLVANAHEYLDQAIKLTIDVSFGMNGFETYQQCFDFFEWEFRSYMSKLQSLPAFDADTSKSVVWSRSEVARRRDVLLSDR